MTDSSFTERVVARRLMEQALTNPSGPVMLGSDTAIYLAKAVAIPSLEAGARAIARTRGHDPDDLAPLTEMCTGDNKQVPWWKVFEEDAEACLLLARIEKTPVEDDNWSCAAKKQALPEPAECDWPMCGCDPKAVAVLAALEDQGISLEPCPSPSLPRSSCCDATASVQCSDCPRPSPSVSRPHGGSHNG